MVIGYRTVSTRHATISYSRGEFHYQDARSSNGSLLYLRGPLEIPTSRGIRLRMGRSILSLRARQSLQLASLPRRAAADAWRWLSSSLGGSGGGSGGGGNGGSAGAHGREQQEERRSGGGGGGGGSSLAGEGGPHPTGVELLRDLHMGRFQQGGDAYDESSLYLADDSLLSHSGMGMGGSRSGGGGVPGRCLRTEASGEGRGLLFHLDSSCSSIAGDGSGSGGGGGGGQQQQQQRRRGGRGAGAGGSGGGGGAGNGTGREWSTRGNVLHLAAGAGSGEAESKSSSSSRGGEGGGEREEGEAAAAKGEADDEEDEEGGGSPPAFQPSLAHSDLVSAPSRHVALQRTRSSRV